MNRMMIAASAAALLAASSFSALAEQAVGAIQSIDTGAGTVTLDDGHTYVLPPQADLAALQLGMQVKIEYDVGANGEMTATSVEPAA